MFAVQKETGEKRDFLRLPDNLSEIQAAYGTSCSKYEALADKAQGKKCIVVSGIGCTLFVKNDALHIVSGRTHHAQNTSDYKLARGTHDIEHIVMMADKKGSITLDALSWLETQDVMLSVLDFRGNVVQSFGHTRSNAGLRRKQYTANAAAIALEIIGRKIMAQIETVRALMPDCQEIDILERSIGIFALDTVPDEFMDVDYLRLYEGRAARAYFSAWKGLPIKWDAQTKKSIPEHWKIVTERTSALSHGNAKNATNPAHAMLNYAYALLEAQCRHALNAVGLDVACGFIHSDLKDRDSLVYDLMELHRARVDALVLGLLKKTTFTRGDYMATKDGSFRWNPQISRYIAASTRLSQKEIDESAAWLARLVEVLPVAA